MTRAESAALGPVVRFLWLALALIRPLWAAMVQTCWMAGAVHAMLMQFWKEVLALAVLFPLPQLRLYRAIGCWVLFTAGACLALHLASNYGGGDKPKQPSTRQDFVPQLKLRQSNSKPRQSSSSSSTSEVFLLQARTLS